MNIFEGFTKPSAVERWKNDRHGSFLLLGAMASNNMVLYALNRSSFLLATRPDEAESLVVQIREWIIQESRDHKDHDRFTIYQFRDGAFAAIERSALERPEFVGPIYPFARETDTLDTIISLLRTGAYNCVLNELINPSAYHRFMTELHLVIKDYGVCIVPVTASRGVMYLLQDGSVIKVTTK